MYKPQLVTILMFLAMMSGLSLRAQDVILPGSTPQGDILRGQGQFLKGMAWYELNAARARELDFKTAREMDQWNREVYETYERELTAAAVRRRSVRNERLADAKRRVAERELRLRTKPTVDDIQSGDALNALLLDLSDPSISESTWRYAKVPLPDSLSIPRLIFQFAARRGDKASQTLTRSRIALGRLDVKGQWPTYLAMNELAGERRSYERVYAKVKSQSLEGKLTLDAILEFDQAVAALDAKARKEVPTARSFRVAAVQAANEIKKAARVFDATTVGFAQEMIADTHNHQAQTVGELLAFMRKYRLLFAPADKRPEDAEQYLRLYRLLREQKDRVGAADVSKDVASVGPTRTEVAAVGAAGLEIRPFNGHDLGGWNGFRGGRVVNPASTCRIDGEEIVWDINRYGRIYSNKSFADFSLKFEYLVPVNARRRQAYCLLRLTEVESYEIGPARFRAGEVGCSLISGDRANTGDIIPFEYDSRLPGNVTAPRSSDSERAASEWNEAEVKCEDSVIQFLLNSREVNRVQANRHIVCHPGFQAFDTDLRIRNIRITPIGPTH